MRLSVKGVGSLLVAALVLLVTAGLGGLTGAVTVAGLILLVLCGLVRSLMWETRRVLSELRLAPERISTAFHEFGQSNGKRLAEHGRKLDDLLASGGRARQDAEFRHQADHETRADHGRKLDDLLASSDRARQDAELRHQADRERREQQHDVLAGVTGSLNAMSRDLTANMRGTDNALQSISAKVTDEQERLGQAIATVMRWLHDNDQEEKKLWRERSDALLRQVEAMINLHRLIEVRGDVPHSRGWALSPDALLTVAAIVLAHKPGCVVECGSGTSSVWLGYAAEAAGGGTRVVSLEHDPGFAEATRRRLREHGLDAYVEVRDAELAAVDLHEKSWSWYDPRMWSTLSEVDLLLVDGPPEGTQKLARYPAVPLLHQRLTAGAYIMLDDTRRPDEQEIIRRWLDEFPDLTVTDLGHEKGAVLLVRGSNDRSRSGDEEALG